MTDEQRKVVESIADDYATRYAAVPAKIVLLAVYLVGCLFVVPYMLFCAALGGQESDLLPAILFGLAWPVTLPCEIVRALWR